MESFLHSLKTEWTDHNKYKTRDADVIPIQTEYPIWLK